MSMGIDHCSSLAASYFSDRRKNWHNHRTDPDPQRARQPAVFTTSTWLIFRMSDGHARQVIIAFQKSSVTLNVINSVACSVATEPTYEKHCNSSNGRRLAHYCAAVAEGAVTTRQAAGQRNARKSGEPQHAATTAGCHKRNNQSSAASQTNSPHQFHSKSTATGQAFSTQATDRTTTSGPALSQPSCTARALLQCRNLDEFN